MFSTQSHQFKPASLGFVITTLLSSLQHPRLISAQATPDQLSTANSQFDSLSLSAAYPDGFGIPLKSQAILNVAYPSGAISLGKNYSASAVSTLPTISVVPSNVDAFKAPNVFTLMLADANALGNPDKDGNYRHFLENSATFGDVGNDGAMTLNAGSGTVVTNYAGPGPLPNTGPHRYAWMLFSQPSSFHAPSNLSNAGTPPSHWFVNSYVSSTGLGDLIAASFFIVENGHNKTLDATRANSTSSTNSTSTNQTSSTNSNNSTSATRNNAQNSGSDGGLRFEMFKIFTLFFGLSISLLIQ